MATINFSKDIHGDAINAIRKYKNIKAKIAELEKELDCYKDTILEAMGTNDTAIAKVGGVTLTVTNKAITSTRVDTAKVKAKFPDTWGRDFGTTSTSPRFTIK